MQHIHICALLPLLVIHSCCSGIVPSCCSEADGDNAMAYWVTSNVAAAALPLHFGFLDLFMLYVLWGVGRPLTLWGVGRPLTLCSNAIYCACHLCWPAWGNGCSACCLLAVLYIASLLAKKLPLLLRIGRLYTHKASAFLRDMSLRL